MAKRFTAATIEHLKPDPIKRLELPDEAVRGLYFVIQPTGVRSWAFRYRAAGKPAKLTLGAYPALSLGEARAAARAARDAVDRGGNPAAAKSDMNRRRRDGAAALGSVQMMYEEFVRRHVDKRNKPRTAAETKRLFTSKVLPSWGARQIRDITRKDVRELIEGIEEAGTPIAANRTLTAVKTLFNWAMKREELDANPAAGVEPVGQETSRDRVLTDAEIKAFWHATAKTGEPFGPMLRLLLLTGQRRSEVAEIRDDEIVDGVWTIPPARTKNREKSVVHLSDAAKAELASVTRIGEGGWVFSTTGKTPVSGFSNAKAAIDRHMLAALQADAAKAGRDPASVVLVRWTPHDLRRTMATGLQKLGVAIPVIEAVLNHLTGQMTKVGGVYMRHDYSAEKAAALDLWAAHILQLVGEATPKLNVVALRSRRA
jgi:integrase